MHTGADIGRHSVNNLKLYVPREESAGAEHWRDQTNRGLVQEEQWADIKDDHEVADPDLPPEEGSIRWCDTMAPPPEEDTQAQPHATPTAENVIDEDAEYWTKRTWCIRRRYQFHV